MIARAFRPSCESGTGIVVLSGLDGTGKSTQAELLSRRLAEEGISSEIIWNRWKPILTAPLIAGARKWIGGSRKANTEDYERFTSAKKQKMRGRFKRDMWQLIVWSEYLAEVQLRLFSHGYPFRKMIFDRYVYDTLVDIAINLSIGKDRIETLCGHFPLTLFPRPALAIFIDIDPALGVARKDDGTPRQYLEDRRDLYLAMAELTGSQVIDGSKPVESVHERIWELTSAWRRMIVAGPSGKNSGGAS